MQKIDNSKLNRQIEASLKWRNNKGIGTLWHIMRFGKTYEALLIANRMIIANNFKLRIVIITPSVAISENWNTEINDFFGSNENAKLCINVYTSNEVLTNRIKVNANLMIIDEIHKFTTDVRYEIIKGNYIKYKHILGLTGTYPYGDDKIKLDKYCPVIDYIDEIEAIKKGWISNFIEFNVRLEFPDDSKILYEKYTTKISELLKSFKGLYIKFNNVFTSDYDLIVGCHAGKTINVKASNGDYVREYISSDIICKLVSDKMGWNNELPFNDYNKRIIEDWNPDTIHSRAGNFNRIIKNRNDIIINSKSKSDAAIRIFETNVLQSTICFNESTILADTIADTINSTNDVTGHNAISYHSNISSKPLIDPKTDMYYIYGKSAAKSGQIKMFGKAKLLKDAIAGMISNRYDIICTAKALDEGVNIPNIAQVITTGGSTNPTQYSQRTARGKTVDIYNRNKITKIYNLYFDDFNSLTEKGRFIKSRDKTKLIQRQKTTSTNSVKWININDI